MAKEDGAPIRLAGRAAYLSFVILLTEVRKRYGNRGVEALRGVSLSIAAGECVAVTGANGAGKSTLLALVLGFLRPTHGSVTVDGLEPRVFVRRQGAGWVPERFGLPRAWKTRTALEHFARLDGHGSDAVEISRSALEHFGLGAHAARRAADLSHGLGRRLALAIATVTPRRLIAVDEPTEGLDEEGRGQFFERCEWLRSHGTTVLMASQDARAVERLAGRAVHLDRGRVRDVVTLRTGAGPAAWRIELEREFVRIAEFFPGAEVDASGCTFRVLAADAAEMSSRLRSLLDAGAVIRSVRPAGPRDLPPAPPGASDGGSEA